MYRQYKIIGKFFLRQMCIANSITVLLKVCLKRKENEYTYSLHAKAVLLTNDENTFCISFYVMNNINFLSKQKDYNLNHLKSCIAHLTGTFYFIFIYLYKLW